jgi:hypothetical protein
MGLKAKLKSAFLRDKIDTSTFVVSVGLLVAGTQGCIDITQWFAGFLVLSIVGFFGRNFRDQ